MLGVPPIGMGGEGCAPSRPRKLLKKLFHSIVGGNVTFLENVGNGFAIRGKFSIMYIYHTAKAAGRLELLARKDTRLWEKTKYG